MPRVTANGVELAYEDSAALDGAATDGAAMDGAATPGATTEGAGALPVLFISGLGYGGWVWRDVVRALGPSLRSLTFDARGVGGSSRWRGPATTRLLAEDALGLLDGLGVPRAHVVGHSLGGMVAQELALLAPERVGRLVLVGTSPGGPHAAPFSQDAVRALTNRWGDPRVLFLAGLELATAQGFLARHPRVAEDTWERRLACPVSPAGYQALLEAAATHDAWARLPGLAVPTLLVHGAEDRMIPPLNSRLMADRLRDARVHLLPGVGHMVPLETPESLATLVRDFARDFAEG